MPSNYNIDAILDNYVDNDMAGFNAAFGAVKPYHRGDVIASATLAAIGRGMDAVDMTALVTAMQAFRSPTTSRKSDVLDAGDAADIRINIAGIIRDAVYDWSDGSDATDEKVRNYVNACVDAAVKAVADTTTGSRTKRINPVTGKAWTLDDVVANGSMSVGDAITWTYNGKTFTGTIDTADNGTAVLTVGKKTFTSLSAACTGIGGTTKSGKPVAVDGWGAWKLSDGRVMDTLRG